MTTIDVAQICALLNVAVDIAGPKVAAFYRTHGVGAEQEANVITMLNASMDCLMRATALAAAHEPTRVAMERRVAKLREVIEDHEFQLEAWRQVPILIAEEESQYATKH